jgi:hypothetical protein
MKNEKLNSLLLVEQVEQVEGIEEVEGFAQDDKLVILSSRMVYRATLKKVL